MIQGGRSTTPLILAADLGHLAVVNALLEAGAEIDSGLAAGITPLYVRTRAAHDVTRVRLHPHTTYPLLE